MRFQSREEAGQILGEFLAQQNLAPHVLIGLPRGGLVVAAEVADILQRPLTVLVVRKIGHPHYREIAIGALAEAGVVIVDKESLAKSGVVPAELDEVIREETARLHSYQNKFHPALKPDFSGKTVLMIDDGLATGATAEAAIASVRKQGAGEVIFAVPVATPSAMQRLRNVADKIFALHVDPDFIAVGDYYDYFPQTSDEEVLKLLNAHARTA